MKLSHVSMWILFQFLFFTIANSEKGLLASEREDSFRGGGISSTISDPQSSFEDQNREKNRTQTILRIIPSDTLFYSQPMIISANVIQTHLPGPTPTGIVQFKINGKIVASNPLVDGSAKFSTSSIPSSALEQHYISVNYVGDEHYVSSGDSFYLTILPASTTMSMNSSRNPSNWGQETSFVVNVTANAPATATPDGMVQFKIDKIIVANIPLDANGQAIFSTSDIPAGNHEIVAIYKGNSNFSGSWANGVQQINKTNTSIQVTSSLNPITYGQGVAFTATVTSENGKPSGMVQFAIDGRNYDSPVPIDSSGRATVSIPRLSGGYHHIRVEYLGDTNFSSSTSVLTQQAIKVNSTTKIASSVNPSSFGEPVTFTANVNSEITPISGGVQFKIDDHLFGSPVSIDNQGNASITIPLLNGGFHRIGAQYLGDENYHSSADTVNQQIDKADVSLFLSSTSKVFTSDKSVIFTSKVDSKKGNPTGTIQFTMDGENLGAPVLLDTTSQASLKVNHVSEGNHEIQAIYSGNENFNESTSEKVGISVKNLSEEGKAAG